MTTEKEFNFEKELIEMKKKLEKECFDDFGFCKNNDVKWVIKKTINLCFEVVDKKEKEFIRLIKKELNPLDFDKGDNWTTTIAQQNAVIDKLSGDLK